MADADRLCERLADDVAGVFPEVVAAVSTDLYSGAVRMLGDRQEAEDVTQEALVRAYQALATYPADRIRDLRLRGWIWTIAANLCRTRLRQRARRPNMVPGETELADDGDGPEARAVRSAERDELARHLLGLPWAMRSAVVLRHVVGLTSEEIAEATGRKPSTVRSDLKRGLARLRAAYGEDHS